MSHLIRYDLYISIFGNSFYRAIRLDAAGAKVHIMNHRLIGHHLIFDFPLMEPKHWWAHLEHVGLSDLPTKQGVPILPARLIKNTEFYEHAKKIGPNWNQVNLFKGVAGGISIFTGYRALRRGFNQETKASPATMILTVGTGAIEIAIGVETCNVFLVIGGGMKLSAALLEYTKSEAAIEQANRVFNNCAEKRLARIECAAKIDFWERRAHRA